MSTRSITRKQIRFVDAYLATWSQVEAARAAGYAFPQQAAWHVINKPLVAAEIKKRMSDLAMAAEEVLLRLGQMAACAPADFFVFEQIEKKNAKGELILDKKGESVMETVMQGVNWAFLQKHSHLVKKIAYTRDGRPVLEFHDPLVSLDKIGKHLKLFTDNVDVTSGGKPLKENDDGRDRALLSLADAIRETLSRPDAKQPGAVDAAVETAVAGPSQSSG